MSTKSAAARKNIAFPCTFVDTQLLFLSPFIKGGTVSNVGYNHYSMLKSVEDIFRLPYLGYAGQPGLVPFGADVFTRANPHRLAENIAGDM